MAGRVSVGRDFTVTWSPNGSRLAAISDWGRSISVFDRSGKAITQIERHSVTGPYLGNSLAFMPDNKTLVGPAPSSTLEEANSSVALWDTDTGKIERLVGGPMLAATPENAFPYNGAKVFAVSPNRQRIASSTYAYGQPVTVYSTKDWSIAQRVQVRFSDVGSATPGDQRKPDAPIDVCAVAFSANGAKLALGVLDGGFAEVDLEHPSQLPVFTKSYDDHGSVCSLAFSPDGRLLAIAKRTEFATTSRPTTATQRISQAALKIWDLGASRFSVFDPDAPETIGQMSWSGDSRYLAIAADDHTVRIYRPSEGGTPVATMPFSDPVMSIAFNLDDEFVVASGTSVTIYGINN